MSFLLRLIKSDPTNYKGHLDIEAEVLSSIYFDPHILHGKNGLDAAIILRNIVIKERFLENNIPDNFLDQLEIISNKIHLYTDSKILVLFKPKVIRNPYTK